MRILADENIAQVRDTFSPYGELVTVPGRAIDASLLDGVDVLLVRSVTRVDAQLLARSPCRFVATATSGTDHVDVGWLQERGIHFADAHGCNAGSVVDYVLSALAALALEAGEDWRRRSIGILGCGAVGSRLAERCTALGMDVRVHDPFLDATHRLAARFADFDTVLRQDIVSLHVPLTRSGPWPTWQLLDTAGLQRLRADAILLNAARGGVIDEAALHARLAADPGFAVVLDTWSQEPAIDAELHARVRLGTPHIAGYSHYGKLLGTHMIHEAFCRAFAIDSAGEVPGLDADTTLALADLTGQDEAQALNRCLLQVYDVREDHRCLREALAGADAALRFDSLRRHYPLRREFGACRLPNTGIPPGLERALLAAGFRPGRD